MLRWLFALLGFGLSATTVVAFIVAGLLLGPLLVWLAWNVLDLAHAVGAGELGFWGIVLLALFLAIGLLGRILVAGIVFLVDPSWLHAPGAVHWPEPTVRNFVAILLLLLVASASARPPREGRRCRTRTV
jgi:hypothetical protein